MGHDLTDAPIVLTGAGGFLGRHVRRALADRTVRLHAGRTDGDLGDPAVVRRCVPEGAMILHLAAPRPRSAVDYADETAADEGLRLVERLLTRRPARFVFTSSMTVYRTPPARAVREEEADPPADGYAGAKRRAELAIREAGVPGWILRLPGLFGGDRRDGLIAALARAYLAGEAPTIDPDPPVWAAMDVEDAAAACVAALDAEPPAQPPEGPAAIVNVGYPGRFSVPDAAARMARLCGVQAPSEATDAPVFEMDLGAYRRWFGPPPDRFEERLAVVAARMREAAA